MRNIWKKVADVLTSAGISALAAAILVVPNSGSRTFASTGPGTTNKNPPPKTCKGAACDTGCKNKKPFQKPAGVWWCIYLGGKTGCNPNAKSCTLCICTTTNPKTGGKCICF